ncbi:NTP transferase domain-containing protein [Sandaracinobacteroides saxicola]|uniref:NTP transferase domain-containing protein n=1 Tax=Sandaracinobacteroides saxicola TaxID=2759707 RepID=A0A7G5IIE8_9SPHN|nr:NTP transferase domain-containing protein [Sandaracinobacteroides saxicola]QMW23140.1 NTP transferase domain-containing protein [Sandaracinobacteroides saxicola]
MTGGTAVLLAGARPGVDPLARAAGVRLKAMIPVAGVPMVRRVALTLHQAGFGRILLLAQSPDEVMPLLAGVPGMVPRASGAGIAASIASLLDEEAVAMPLLVTTADHALLTPAMVMDFRRSAAGADAAAGVVAEATVTAAFPGTRRTWLRFAEGGYSGANLFWLGSRAALPAVRLWAGVEQDRKRGFALLWQLGPALALGAALRLLTLEGAVRRLGARLGLTLRAVVLDHAGAAVDVDSVADLALAEARLS